VKHRRSGQLAFTLLEVLATLVLIGLVLPVALRGLNLSLRAAGDVRQTLQATELARRQLAQMQVERDVNRLTGSGDFGDSGPGFRWQSASQSLDYGLYEVTVTVTWQQRSQTRQVALTTLIRPTSTLLSLGGRP
jgi:prepilin-type N-terminal cleavage/methylation domain-containing protein